MAEKKDLETAATLNIVQSFTKGKAPQESQSGVAVAHGVGEMMGNLAEDPMRHDWIGAKRTLLSVGYH